MLCCALLPVMSDCFDYDKYIAYITTSPEWARKRAEVIRIQGGRCAGWHGVCRSNGQEYVLTIHHLTYERLYNEDLEDLVGLCPLCHALADSERKYKTRVEKRIKAVNTYASKRWGEDWDDYRDWEEASEAFDEWLEEKGDHFK